MNGSGSGVIKVTEGTVVVRMDNGLVSFANVLTQFLHVDGLLFRVLEDVGDVLQHVVGLGILTPFGKEVVGHEFIKGRFLSEISILLRRLGTSSGK